MSTKKRFLVFAYAAFCLLIMLATMPVGVWLHSEQTPYLLELARQNRHLTEEQTQYWIFATKGMCLMGVMSGLAVAMGMREFSRMVLLSYFLTFVGGMYVLAFALADSGTATSITLALSSGLFIGLLYWPISAPIRHQIDQALA